MKKTLNLCSGLALALVANGALADITITQSAAAAPTYATTLDFDELGGPTGSVDPGAWASIGVTELQAGDGQPWVGDNDSWNGGWGLGTGNSFFGNFGVFMTFADDLTNFSAQIWDPSGPPGIFGGLAVFVFNDGIEVAAVGGFTPAWGGLGDEWFDVSATGGMVFDEVRILGFGFFPTTFMDNASWNMVPAPGGLALLGLGVLATRRRR